MHVIAFNSSPRKNGNTSLMVQYLFKPLEKHGITTEEIRIGGHKLHGCIACGACRATIGKCVQTDDPMNEWIDALRRADGVVLASPTYFANINTEMKAFIDRAGYVSLAEGFLRRRVGVPVVVARRGGAMQTYNALMAFFGIAQMVVPMSSYWNMGYGMDRGEVANDAEGLKTMENLGENMAWVMRQLVK